MSQKAPVRFKDWSKGVLTDIDPVDAPIDSLSSCTNFRIKNGYLEALDGEDSVGTLTGLTSPKRAFLTRSRYDIDGNIESTDYLYVYDRSGFGGEVVRFHKTPDSSTWSKDSGFSVTFAPAAIDAGFAVIGDTVGMAGSEYSGDRYAHPYNEFRFESSESVKGWLTANGAKPTVYADSDSGVVDSTLNSDQTKFGVYYRSTSTSTYTANDNILYYIAFKNHAGHETEAYNFLTLTSITDFAGYEFYFKATASLAEEWKEVILYKELNGGGKYFLGSCDLQDGFVQDFSNSGTVSKSNGGWNFSDPVYTTKYSVGDYGVYNQPYDYVSERNGVDKLPNACITDFRGRFLLGGEGGQTNGVRIDAIYVSGLSGIGSLYGDNYLTINNAGGREVKTIKTFGNYILVFYDEITVLLDGSHPSPSMWKVIGTFLNGVDSDRAVIQTNTGIIFANENSVFIFNGKFQDIIHKYNRSLYESFVSSGSDDIVVTYNSVEQLILIAGRSYMLTIDKDGALTKMDSGLTTYVLVEGQTYYTDYISSTTIYRMFTGSTLSGSIESHDIVFDDFNDKLLFKVRIRLYSSSSTTASYTISFDKGDSLTGTITVNGDTEKVIMCKNRFKTLKYSVSVAGNIKEVNFLIGARKENRHD